MSREKPGHGHEVDPKGFIARLREWFKYRTQVGQFGMTGAELDQFLEKGDGGKSKK